MAFIAPLAGRGGISIRTLHRWPDKVGEKINPFHPERAVA